MFHKLFTKVDVLSFIFYINKKRIDILKYKINLFYKNKPFSLFFFSIILKGYF